MKLSEKGKDKFVDAMNHHEEGLEFYSTEWSAIEDSLIQTELEPSDLNGAVVLTVEEAEKLMKLLDLCEYWLTNNNVCYDCDAWASLLEERIEQAENGNEAE